MVFILPHTPAGIDQIAEESSPKYIVEAVSPPALVLSGRERPDRHTIPENFSEFDPVLKTLDLPINNEDTKDRSNHLQKQSSFVPDENLYPSRANIFQTRLALNSGVEHINTVGKLKKARKLLGPCKKDCNRCERPKLHDNERDLILKSFWNLKDHEQQWLFIFNSIKLIATKKKFCSKGTRGEKAFSRHYSFMVNGNHRKVCKTMFTSTLNICDSWIVSALSHCSEKSEVIPDQRGKHKSSRK